MLIPEVVELCSSSIPTQQSSSKLGFAFAAPSVDTCFPEKDVIFLKKLALPEGVLLLEKTVFSLHFSAEEELSSRKKFLFVLEKHFSSKQKLRKTLHIMLRGLAT